jgi:exodeoxyribonuclease VII large subunit
VAKKPIKVGSLNSYIKRILSSDPILSNVSVIGEISNFKYHSNGHVYFSLKDDSAKINCFLPGDVYQELAFSIEDGKEIICEGYINVYEKGGTYSLNIRKVEMSGEGGLAAAFENLKEKLRDEGLFDTDKKKELPSFPKTVAIITSPTGAAIQDMLSIITEKNEYVDILVYPTLVQGPTAGKQIAEGIEFLNENRPETDIIIVGRGGGSIEELWAFNEETVARAIFASQIPIISAVGHETDVTISDFVADARGETPTAAAHMAVPDITEIRRYLWDQKIALRDAIEERLSKERLRVEALRMDRLGDMIRERVKTARRISLQYRHNMKTTIGQTVFKYRVRTDEMNVKIKALNPKSIMERGYAALIDENGRSVRSIKELKPADKIEAVLADGRAALSVKELL